MARTAAAEGTRVLLHYKWELRCPVTRGESEIDGRNCGASRPIYAVVIVGGRRRRGP